MPGPWPTFPVLGSRLVSEFRGDYNDITNGMLTAFAGVDEPTPKYPGQFWVDASATPKLLKQRNTANTAWIVRARVDQDWGGLLPVGGGSMEGAINMGGFGITNLPAGSGAAPARYQDLAPYAKLDGSSPFTGIPSGPAMDPSLANQLARKAYVDAKAIAGGTFTGKITMPFAPVAGSNELARAVDLENTIGVHNHSGGAGQGVKIPVTSLSGAGAGKSDGPRYDGTNMVFAPNGALADSPGILTIWDTIGGNVALTTVDLSAYVPATSRMAILELFFHSEARGGSVDSYFTVDLRRTGATNFYSYLSRLSMGVDPGGDPGAWGFDVLSSENSLQVFVYLDLLRKMDVRVTGTGTLGTSCRSRGRLVGYL